MSSTTFLYLCCIDIYIYYQILSQNTNILFRYFFQENISNAERSPMWFPYHVLFISNTMALHSACCRVALAEAIVGAPCNSLYNVCHILDWPKAAARIKPITTWYNVVRYCIPDRITTLEPTNGTCHNEMEMLSFWWHFRHWLLRSYCGNLR